jgi:hypothetical protein
MTSNEMFSGQLNDLHRWMRTNTWHSCHLCVSETSTILYTYHVLQVPQYSFIRKETVLYYSPRIGISVDISDFGLHAGLHYQQNGRADEDEFETFYYHCMTSTGLEIMFSF